MKAGVPIFKDMFRLIGISALVTLFITQHAFAQDTVSNPAKKNETVRIKVITDDNGKTIVKDTTFKGNYSDADIQKYMDEFQGRMKDFEKGMKDFEKGMKEMEIRLQDMNIPDSGMLDSLGNFAGNFRFDWNGKDHPNLRMNRHPRSFSYSFDMPDIPDLPELPDIPAPPDINSLPEPPVPPAAPEFHFRGKKQNTLSNVLGDIPMDNVKSYTIKDIKGGKRIVIELNDSPVLRPERRDVIILRDNPGRHAPSPHPRTRNYERKIIINKDKPGPQEEEPAPDVR